MIILRDKSFSSIDSDAELGNSLIMSTASGLGAFGGLKYHKYKDKKDLNKLFKENEIKTKEKIAQINEEYKNALENFKKNKEKIRFKSVKELNLDKKRMIGNDQSRGAAEKEVLKRFKGIKDKKVINAIMEEADNLTRKSNYLKARSINRLGNRMIKGSLIGSAVSIPAMMAYKSTKDPKVIEKKREKHKITDSAPSLGAMIGLGYGAYKSDPFKELSEEVSILNEPKKSKRILKRIKQSKKYIVPAAIGSSIGYAIKKVGDTLDDRKEAIKIRNKIKESEARLKELEKNKKK